MENTKILLLDLSENDKNIKLSNYSDQFNEQKSFECDTEALLEQIEK